LTRLIFSDYDYDVAATTNHANMTLRMILSRWLAAAALALPVAALADGALLTPWTTVHAPPSPAVQPSAEEPIPVSTDLPAEAEVDYKGEQLVDSAPEDAEEDQGDLWDRIRAGFAMEEIDSTLVQRHEAWYLNRPDYVRRMIDRSRLYLFHIVEEVEKRGMPMEIALLPMIESAYNPSANSHMRAAGMWQFIPSTGRKYGLQQTWWYDGRRDVLAATRAALDYLQFLHDSFGDWELALAAYNCGEGNVQRAIARNRKSRKPTNYLSLKLPKETRNYLPKLQAVKNIIADPSLLRFELEPIPNRPYFTIVEAPRHIDVAMAAKLADMPVEEFLSLNPGHRRPVITPVGNAQLLVPVDKADLFQSNLESNDEPLVSWQTYQLKKGEKLDKVARDFDISVQRLKEVNGLTGRKRVRHGQMLLVPLEGEDTGSNLDETYKSPDFQAPAEESRSVYRVKSGDTLSSIARRHGTSVSQLKKWNGLRSDRLSVGQRLTIWREAEKPRRAMARG
jgi:membrane-bound lytic murein transglycosylase D